MPDATTENVHASRTAPAHTSREDTFWRALLRPFRSTPKTISPNNLIVLSYSAGEEETVPSKNPLVNSDDLDVLVFESRDSPRTR